MTEPLKTYIELFDKTTRQLKEALAMKNKYHEILHKIVMETPKNSIKPELCVEIINLLAEDQVEREETDKFLDEVISTLENLK